MEEDTVIASTEINGNGSHSESTVNAPMIAMERSPFSNAKSQQLPLHNNTVTSYFPQNQKSHSVGGPPGGGSSSEASVSELGSEMDTSSPPKTQRVEIRVAPPPRFPPLPYSSSRTGLVYDVRMRYHAEPTSLVLGQGEIHPEDPRRIHEIFEEIRAAGLVQGQEDPQDEANDDHCWRIHARPADKGEICLIHTPAHYDFIETLQSKPPVSQDKKGLNIYSQVTS
jgi:histone deacetylase 6